MLPQYVKKLAQAGRTRVSSLENPKRRLSDNVKLWTVEDKSLFGDNAWQVQEINPMTDEAIGKPVMVY